MLLSSNCNISKLILVNEGIQVGQMKWRTHSNVTPSHPFNLNLFESFEKGSPLKLNTLHPVHKRFSGHGIVATWLQG